MNDPLIGRVAGTTPRIVAGQYSKPASATQYTIGDIIGNDATAGNVVPLKFPLPRPSGRITGARCTVNAASGTLSLPGFDLLLFRPVASVPFADAGYAADNGVMNITAAAYRDLVAVLTFSASNWRNQLGASSAAGAVAWQDVILTRRPFAPFNIDDPTLATKQLIGVMQDASGWTPTNVVYTFDFALDVDLD